MKDIYLVQTKVSEGVDPEDVDGLTVLDFKVSDEIKDYCRIQTQLPNGDIYTTLNYNGKLLYVVFKK